MKKELAIYPYRVYTVTVIKKGVHTMEEKKECCCHKKKERTELKARYEELSVWWKRTHTVRIF